MANITTNTLKIGDNNLVLRDADAQAKITTLKEDLIAKEDFQYEIIQNSYPDASGGFPTYNGWDRTDYISIDGGSDIYIDNTNGYKSEDNAWYDESKGIIDRFTVAVGSDVKITAPANARYMVVSTRRVQFYHEIYHYTARYATKEQLSVVSDNVDANTEAIESLNPVVLPDYYFAENYIQNKIATINGNTPLDGVTFAFITDLHFFSNQLKSLPLLQYIRANTSLDTIVSGGDYVQAYGGQADIDFAKEKVIKYAKTLYPDWLSVRGNHDFTIRTDASASTGITEDDRATYYAIVRVSADWRYEVVTPEHDIINTTYNIYKNYNWVATNEQAKVKIIGLCDYNTTKTSAYWGVSRFFTNAYAAYFCQMLNDCDGYTVVVVTHAPITDQLQGGASNRLTEVIEAYANRRTVTFGSYSYDFSQATGVIACALSGHWHADQNAVVNGVLHINTTCDALYQDDGYNRTAGTVSEQAFDVINLDTANKTIKITRIGGGNDRNFTY